MTLQQEQENRRSRTAWTALIAVGLTLGSVGETQALNITTCPNITITSDNLVLTANISVTSGDCIDIDNGHDVNMNGYTISCAVGHTCGTAIKALASGTDVTGGSGNINGLGDAYDGTFAVAIDGATTVSGVHSWTTQAIKDTGSRLKSLTNGYMYCAGTGTSICVDVTMPRSTDEILNNTIVSEGNAVRIQGATSGSGATIQGNYVGCDFNNTGIEQDGATKNIRVYTNTIDGCPTTFDIDNTSLVTDIDQWRGNICDDTYYCPPVPTCSNGGDPICGPNGVYVHTALVRMPRPRRVGAAGALGRPTSSTRPDTPHRRVLGGIWLPSGVTRV